MPAFWTRALPVLLAPALLACRPDPRAPRPSDASAERSDASASATDAPETSDASDENARANELTPLDAGAGVIELAVPEFRASLVSVPNGAVGPRPVVVAPHGIGDRPDWQCNEWRRRMPDVWTLCPRGVVSERWTKPGDTRWTWDGPIFMKREIDASILALAARFGPWVDTTAMVYGGFSYGAANGVAIVAREAERFPYVILTEGGGDRWTLDLAKEFVKNGGKRVLFVCGQAACAADAERTAEMIGRVGVDAKVDYARGAGHTYGGAVAEHLLAAWPWATRADPRWTLH